MTYRNIEIQTLALFQSRPFVPTMTSPQRGQESPEFAELFPGLEYLDGGRLEQNLTVLTLAAVVTIDHSSDPVTRDMPGVDSGFKHVVPEGHDTKLYQVRRVHGKTTVLQVPAMKETRLIWTWGCDKQEIGIQPTEVVEQGYTGDITWDIMGKPCLVMFGHV